MIRANHSGSNPLTGQALSNTGISSFTHGTGFLDANGFIHYTSEANYFGAANDAVFDVNGECFYERRAV